MPTKFWLSLPLLAIMFYMLGFNFGIVLFAFLGMFLEWACILTDPAWPKSKRDKVLATELSSDEALNPVRMQAFVDKRFGQE